MTFSSRTALLGFLLALSALAAQPAGATAVATTTSPLAASIEGRMGRIAAAFRERQGLTAPQQGGGEGTLLSYGFANRVGGGGFVNGARGGFGNVHPYYGGGGVGFVNGGGGFVNARNGGGFVNGPVRGGVFRNW
ncbi:MAG: GrrA/OscA1 family cyclophane-containing rSAM-modified RiPP [Synechococcaceae cyanobacterium ELA445]